VSLRAGQEALQGLTTRQREAYLQAALAELVNRSAAKDRTPFEVALQDYQKAPEGDWRVRLFRAGRGAGKTHSGAAWSAEQAENVHPGKVGMVVGPNYTTVKQVMIEGQGSGLLDILGDRVKRYVKSPDLEIHLKSGSVILARSAERPESIRGANLSWAWADELQDWRYREAWHDSLMPALRIGNLPQVMVTCTPRSVGLIRDLREMVESGNPRIVEQTATMFDNLFLSEHAKQDLLDQYGGTEIGRRELYGEYVDSVIGAVWKEAWIKTDLPWQTIASLHGGLADCVVGVDPTGQAEGLGDECGMIVAGRTQTGRGVVIADETISGSPGEWIDHLADVFYSEYTPDRWSPRTVVIEGDGSHANFAKEILNRSNHNIPFDIVNTGSVSKLDRARPISTMWEQGRVDHLDEFDLLVDQMLTWVPGEVKGYSPDRVDALVWAMSYLFPSRANKATSVGRQHQRGRTRDGRR